MRSTPSVRGTNRLYKAFECTFEFGLELVTHGRTATRYVTHVKNDAFGRAVIINHRQVHRVYRGNDLDILRFREFEKRIVVGIELLLADVDAGRPGPELLTGQFHDRQIFVG